MRGLHVPPDVDTGPTRESAHLIDKQLPRPVPRVLASSHAEPLQCGFGTHSGIKPVNNRGDDVVAPQALIQGSVCLVRHSSGTRTHRATNDGCEYKRKAQNRSAGLPKAKAGWINPARYV